MLVQARRGQQVRFVGSLPPPAFAKFRVDDAVAGPAVLVELDDRCRGHLGHLAHRLGVSSRDMGAEDRARQSDQRVAGLGRLVIHDVQARAGEMAGEQGP